MTPADRAALLRDLVQRTGSAHAMCAGTSMEPTLAKGTRVKVLPCPHPRVGDVVLIETNGTPVMHRILARIPGLLVHAGDAPGAKPALLRRQRIIGKVEVPGPTPSRWDRWKTLTRLLPSL